MKLLVGALNREEVLFRHLLWIFWKLNCVDSSRPKPAQCQYKHGMNITMWPSQPVANQTSYAENCLQSTVQSNESGKVFDFYSEIKICFRRKIIILLYIIYWYERNLCSTLMADASIYHLNLHGVTAISDHCYHLSLWLLGCCTTQRHQSQSQCQDALLSTS